MFDISEKAIEVTQKNIQKFKLTERAKALLKDLNNGIEDLSSLLNDNEKNNEILNVESHALSVHNSNSINSNIKVNNKIQNENLNSIKEDLLAEMDIVVSNPPYIAKDSTEVAPDVLQFEPERALFGGEQGWEIYESWSRVAAGLLKPKGIWCSEIGYHQGEILLNLIASQNIWSDIEIRKDLCGQDRYLLARKK